MNSAIAFFFIFTNFPFFLKLNRIRKQLALGILPKRAALEARRDVVRTCLRARQAKQAAGALLIIP
jgi:hypothetical protein